jgi:phosphatidylserine synthase
MEFINLVTLVRMNCVWVKCVWVNCVWVNFMHKWDRDLKVLFLEIVLFVIIWDINIVHNFELNQFNKLKIYAKIIILCFQIVFLLLLKQTFILFLLFRVCKSVHHHTFNWINQPDAETSQAYYLSFTYSSTCFKHPHAHHQELQQLQ